MGGCCGGHGQGSHGQESVEAEQGHGCGSGGGHGHGHGHEHGHGGAATMKATHVGIQVTDMAGKKLKEFLTQEKKGPEIGLRLGVTGGGCSGLSYMMDFDTKQTEDKVYKHEGSGVQVFVDPQSHDYINGAVLDYVEGLQGAGFTIKNPNAKGGCGCGSSFQA